MNCSRASWTSWSLCLALSAWSCGSADTYVSGRMPSRTVAGSSASGPTSAAAAGTTALGTAGNWSGSAGSYSSLLPPPPESSVVNGSDMVCASALIQTHNVTPSIVFVIDGSGSMCEQFGGSTRWQALRSALLDPMKGLIKRLDSSVWFGATLYDGTIDPFLALSSGGSLGMTSACELQHLDQKSSGECPGLTEVMPPKLNNAMAIDAAYPQAELGGSTPTDKAMKHVMDALIATRQPQAPDQQAQNPVYVILATDGAPNDICVNGVGGDGSVQRQGVISAVDAGAAAGITTWVISLAGNDAALQSHLDEVAKHGDPTNSMAHTFNPTNPDDLIMTLAQLLGGAVGCHIMLSGKVTVGQECQGNVDQNGVRLPCCQRSSAGGWTCDGMPAATPDGWHLTDPSSIELLGDSCSKFLLGSDTLLHASFPCSVFLPS